MDHDSALRAHIRRQLLDYVNEHINIDHIAYTEHVATQVGSQCISCHYIGLASLTAH